MGYLQYCKPTAVVSVEIAGEDLYNKNIYRHWEGNRMHQLIIHKLGPIQHCELSIKNYTILTGYQASGKSTIAKASISFVH